MAFYVVCIEAGIVTGIGIYALIDSILKLSIDITIVDFLKKIYYNIFTKVKK